LQHDSVRIVGPSRWIVELARRSSVLSDIDGLVIPNVLGSAWRETVLDIKFKKNRKFTVGVASMDPNSYVKGGDIIQKVNLFLPASEYSMIYLADFNTTEHARFWEQIDCLFVPSRADNSPTVIHEARSLGIPVIASQVGGIPEILTDGDICFEIPEKIDSEFTTSIFGKAQKMGRNLESTRILVDRIADRDSGIISSYKDLYSQLLS
jgi:glycosyltransferase involved in cell wall biosynthesis